MIKTKQHNKTKNPTRMDANTADLATSMVIHLGLMRQLNETISKVSVNNV